MDEIASESVLQQSYAWLCERRRDHSPHDDVWDLRWRWEVIRPQLQARLRAGAYRLGPVRRFHQGYPFTIVVGPAAPGAGLAPGSPSFLEQFGRAIPQDGAVWGR
jgi:hypothetical protein